MVCIKQLSLILTLYLLWMSNFAFAADLQSFSRDNQKWDLELKMHQRQDRDRYGEQTLKERRRLEGEFQRQQMEQQSLRQRQRRLANGPGLSLGAANQDKRQGLQRKHRAQQLDFKIRGQFRMLFED